ncbi:hypothetical protein HK107_15340 [Parvularcula sp. ZS-1/3]|uniref:SRPBCC family protein n=1 Tax=Parvularcula mediterranea TaxID=2732508 RepID=A0A7Y3W6C4_9PROT|nr:hypothetical protein [Parvularcula mediterranea]NNU17705.1 hypothetical protein [Parvularcula mediterranea]
MRVIASLLALTLAACGSVAPPDAPPQPTPPPAVATEGLIPVVVTAKLPFSLEEARAFAEANSITDFMEPSGDIAKPVGFAYLEGEWPNPGAVRRVELSDGHYVIERITGNEPELFTYQIWVFTNELRRGLEQVVGIQRFTETAEGTTDFHWTYGLKPKGPLTAFFVRRQVPDVQTYLQTAVDGWAEEAERQAAGE